MIRIQPQFAVFLDNRPGTLAKTCQELGQAHVNILALSILDTVDHAIVRLIVDDPKAAEQVLCRLHPMVQRRDVVVMDVPHTIGALGQVAERLAQAGINMEYAYCTAAIAQSAAMLVLRTNDLEATINALS
jgi:hypothetical protein